MIRSMRLLALCVAASALSAPAWAADCSGLKLLSSFDMSPAENGLFTVSLGVNGNNVNFLVATGATLTQLSPAMVRTLKLPTHTVGVKLLDANGYASPDHDNAVNLDSFRLGKMQSANTTIMLSPDPAFGDGKSYGGALAGDMMGRFDVEFDFAGRKLNYFSQDHCPDQVVYWPVKEAVAIPLRKKIWCFPPT